MLRDWNVTPDFAVTGTEAVSFASKNDYDIILMDIEMPGMNGYRATEMIRNEFEGKKRHVPIVAMTGHAMQGERQKCMDCGMNDYLSKPFQPEDLRKMITRLVNATRNGNTLSTASEKEVIPNYTPIVESNLTNLSFLREISDGNDQFFKEFLEMFIANTPPALQDLQVSYRSKNWEKLRQTAHKMKPSFNYIGMKELNHLSGKVEELARNQAESKEIENMINQILQDTTIALAELKKELTLLPQTK